MIIFIIILGNMELSSRLKKRGHKTTPQRKAVFQVLHDNAGQPINTEEIC
jgi:Fe2+ or Zn2+ uptake regulation protein